MNEHKPVMVAEVLNGLQVIEAGCYLDATFGRGGHTRAILSRLGSSGRLLAMDRDPSAIPYAESLAKNDPRFYFRTGTFSEALRFCESMELVGQMDGILVDLGVSSPQLDDPKRGFSFLQEGPLDMRMDPNTGISASEWINEASETEIDEVLREYGEERFHRRIAHAIVNARVQEPILSTAQLAEVVSKANPAWERHKHPATRSFQALRIFVNRELEQLAAFLALAPKMLRTGGRMAVISFHSLEDRMVKQFIQSGERGVVIPKGLPVKETELEKTKTFKRVGGAQRPTEAEVKANPRSRSAILRVAEKVN